MLIEDSFVVRAQAADVWRLLLDLPAVASCLPGARFDERIDDRTYVGEFRMKVGPIAMRYRGRVVLEDLDERAREATLLASGEDESGGTVSARMRIKVVEAGVDTDVRLSVNVSLTGRAAQFGRNIVEDVARMMIGKFATEFGLRLSNGGAFAAASPGSEREERTSARSQRPRPAAPVLSERVVGAAAFAMPVTGPPPSPGSILYFERRAPSPASTGSAESELDLGSLAFTIAWTRIRTLLRAAIRAVGRLLSRLRPGRGRR